MGGKWIEIGERIGQLVVLSRGPRMENGKYLFHCRCDGCGQETDVLNMVIRRRSSCYECTNKRVAALKTTHGLSKRGQRDRLLGAWKTMIQRCTNPNAESYQWYGAKGIKVCPEWMDHLTFRAWALAHGYAPGLTLDRIDETKDYGPDNCEYVTRSVNSQRMNKKYLGRVRREPVRPVFVYPYDEPTYGDY